MINKNENNIFAHFVTDITEDKYYMKKFYKFADFITECLVEEKSDISQLILNCYK